MKRTVNRTRKLPAFSINIADLEVLLLKLERLFNSTPSIHISFDLPKSETIAFDSIEELKKYQFLKGRITKLRISCSSYAPSQRIVISTRSLSSIGTIITEGEDEAWCAGAIETVFSFLQSYRTWYAFLYALPMGLIYFVMCFAPLIAQGFWKINTRPSPSVAIAYLSTLLTFGFLYLGRDRIFPGTVLRITEETNFITRNVNVLSLLVGVISMIISIVALFVSK